MTTITDSKGTSAGTYSNLGVTLGQPGLIDNDSDTAVLFDGVAGTGQLPAFNLGNGPHTVEIWFRRTVLSGTAAPILIQLDNGFRVGFNPSSGTTTGLNDGIFVGQGGSGATDFSNAAVADTTSRHHLVVTKSPPIAGPGVHVYLDGVDVTGNIQTVVLTNGFNANTWLASIDGSSRFCAIVADEPAIYNVVLTPTQVSNHWQKGAAALFAGRGTVTIGTTNNISTAGATFNGTVNANGTANTNFWFEYGLTTSYGSKSGVFVFSDNTTHSLSQSVVSTFAASTTYHVRLVASNSFGNTNSPDSTFVIPGPATVSTLPVSNTTNTTVTLNGTVNPNGVDTTYHFEYGTTTSYGNSIPGTPLGIGTGSTGVAVSQNVTGLTAGTSYHWRLVATNANGTAASGDTVFQTTGGIVVTTFNYQPTPVNTKFASPNCFWYKPLPSDNSCRLGVYQGRTAFTAWYSNANQYQIFSGNYHALYSESYLLGEVGRQMGVAYAIINVTDWTPVYYCVPANFQLQHLQIYQNGAYQTWCPIINAGFSQTPIPVNETTPTGAVQATQPPAGSDRAVTIYSASLDRLWQTNYSLYSANQSLYPYGPYFGGWWVNCSTSMGVIPNSVVLPGYNNDQPVNPRTETAGSSASGMMVDCGVPKWNDWTTNHAFNHCIYMQSYGSQAMCVYPAYKGDGQGTTLSNAIPHGTMFRFDPALSTTDTSLAGLGVSSPFARAVVRAIQTYGCIFGDGSGTINMSVELITNDAWNPGPNQQWPSSAGFGYNGGTTDSHVIMNQIFSPTMLTHLQVVDPKWLADNHLGEANEFPFL